MNEGQKQFYNYILKRVQKGKEEKVKMLLDASFEKQKDGTFNQEYLQSFVIEILDLIQDDNRDEVKMIMSEFGKKIR